MVYLGVVAEAAAAVPLYLPTRKTRAHRAARHRAREAVLALASGILMVQVALVVAAVRLTERVIRRHKPGSPTSAVTGQQMNPFYPTFRTDTSA